MKIKLSKLMATDITQEYQCIVCKFVRTSPTEMHHHQTHCHTSEELSLSIIGLQLLFNMQDSSQREFTNNATSSDRRNLLNQETSMIHNQCRTKSNFIPESNQPRYHEVQQEPMCLKIPTSNSSSNTSNSQTKNLPPNLKTILKINNNDFCKNINGSKTTLKKRTKPKPLGQRKPKKTTPILPKIQKNFTIDLTSIMQSINTNKNPSNSYERNHLSQSEPICLKLSKKNPLPDINKNAFQVEKSKVISRKPELISKKPVMIFKKSEEIFKTPEVTIQKLEVHLKKPKAVIKKPEVTIRRLETSNKKPEVIKVNEQVNVQLQPKYQLKLEAQEKKIGIFTRNLRSLCNDMQNIYIKKSHPESFLQKSNLPTQKQEPYFETPTSNLQKSESPFPKLEVALKNPELPFRKFSSDLQDSMEKAKKEEIVLSTLKPLPGVQVADGVWCEALEEKLFVECDSPTDITNMAMQDCPNSESCQTSENVSENLIFNDLSNEMLTNLDSYYLMMTSRSQPLDGLHSNFEVMNVDNNFSLQCPDYQLGFNEAPGNDYLNVDTLMLENNQYLLSPVDSNETTWMDSNDNPVYAELQPVSYQ